MTASSIALRALVLGGVAGLLSGCLATAAVGAAGAVASTAVGVTAKAASETVHVGHVAVDAVKGGDDKDQPAQER